MLTRSNPSVSSGENYYYGQPTTGPVVNDPIPVPAPLMVMYPSRPSWGTGPPVPVRLPPISSLVGPPASYVPASGVPQRPPRMMVAGEHACAGAGAGAAPAPAANSLDPAVRLRKQCPVCGKICSRPSTLKTHFLIHTGDTPFKCTWANCNKSFNVKSNMLRHLKSHERKLAKKQAKRVSL
ncbi:hypothetical protein HG536_0G03880 [Torulaspora globosa]|uniref:C2H2-type domain-containing protein n=1 Tax=Torulaspora globosa TaxID=48254 RepID=A0A7G3ZLZ0_9SACH|nr:uncharacterized protein HG536_0G03880 [Torulaspora globosa]QLL34526.1 hypothetical protein HG536_0G03880 [Torulaspora globosa]